MEKGHPWLLCKGWDNFLYLSDMIPIEEIDNPHDVDLELSINKEVKQKDNTKNMCFNIWQQLEHISQYMTLSPGDIIMTGTPEGMGPVEDGDLLEASLTYKGKVISTISDTIIRQK